ncbi:hypothetical protein [Rubricoccus marinus]|uniref:hypothetical protein n=1 Tax=Rubricoccus marinus TaxID=716817 RepID=UPI0015C5CB94|nr:hypothetical protein [Rubricoccus marinus]
MLVALACVAGASAPAAQDVVQMLQDDANRVRSAQAAAEADLTTVHPLPVRAYPQSDWALRRLDADAERQRQREADSLAARADSLLRASRRLTVLDWEKTDPGAQEPFLEDFRETYWKAASALIPSPIDTMGTLELRTRLTQLFGTPTRNAAAAAQERYLGSEFVQFEYWFVVNDTIPLLVLDTAGPFGRGLLIAGRESQSTLMPKIKADLSARLLAAPATVPYVDYYHDFERKQWFKTGFDGEAYFTERIRTPRWARNFVDTKWLIHR